MKWITREHVKVDRVACPWLIKKFIDLEAEFIFLPQDTDWANVRDGIVYDVPNCELGHHGEDVSFNSILKKYHLADPALAMQQQAVLVNVRPELTDFHAIERAVRDPASAVVDEEDKGRGEDPEAKKAEQEADHGFVTSV
jgi:hypothetical protein